MKNNLGGVLVVSGSVFLIVSFLGFFAFAEWGSETAYGSPELFIEEQDYSYSTLGGFSILAVFGIVVSVICLLIGFCCFEKVYEEEQIVN